MVSKNMISKYKKYFYVLLPILFFLFEQIGIILYDKIFGDNDGEITNFLIIRLVSSSYFLIFLWFVFEVLNKLFSVGKTVFFINLLLISIGLFVVNFILKKNDPYILHNKIDSNYYLSNYNKYFNLFEPPKEWTTWGNKVVLNELKYRDKSISKIQENSKKIMVIGDSFTWGAGLDEKSRYTNQLDSLLNHRNKNSYDVLNFANSGACTVGISEKLENEVIEFNPNIVVYGFCSNDVTCESEDHSIQKSEADEKWSGFLRTIQISFSNFKLNYIGEILSKTFKAIIYYFYDVPSYNDNLKRIYDKNSNDWITFEKALLNIYNISTKHTNSRPIIAIFNQHGWIDLGNQQQNKNILFRKTLLNQIYQSSENIGFDILNFDSIIENKINDGSFNIKENLKVHTLDGHPSKYLNKIFSEELYKKIKL